MKWLVIGMLALITCAAGCNPNAPKASDFLRGCASMKNGKHLDRVWTSPQLSRETLARVYVAPVDISRITDQPLVGRDLAGEQLHGYVSTAITSSGNGWATADNAAGSTSELRLAITEMTPGSRSGRFWAAEFGVGHAKVQVEGKLIDTSSGQPLACFADKQSDSGTVGAEDIGHDAGPNLVNRMLENVASNLVKELK